MIPEFIEFTGLTVPTADLLWGYGGRKIYFSPPQEWVRVEINNDENINRAIDQLDNWLQMNITGKWASHMIQRGSVIVVFFQTVDDALLFKLTDGDTAWKSKSSNN